MLATNQTVTPITSNIVTAAASLRRRCVRWRAINFEASRVFTQA
jgi:hypothetical protein